MQAENSLPPNPLHFSNGASLIRRTTRPEQAGTTTILQIVLYTQKNPYLNQDTAKYSCQISLLQKNPEYTSNRTNRIDKNVIKVKYFFF